MRNQRIAIIKKTINVIRSGSSMKIIKAILLRRTILPSDLLKKYDNKVKLHLDKENDFYLFENLEKPHKRLLMMYYCFMSLIEPPCGGGGKNLLEIGVGSGGFSFIAKKFGFDVVSTDNGIGLYEKAGEVSRGFLNIKAIQYSVSFKTSISEVVKFKNNRKADYIVMIGVPFNRETINSNVIYYDADKWCKVLIDFYNNLNPNGIFLDIGVYNCRKEITEQIRDNLLKTLHKEVKIEFNFDNFNPVNNEFMTNIKMIKL